MKFLEYKLKQLKSYCVDIQYIDGLLTFIISPSKYENILKDKKILNLLYKSEKEIEMFIKISKEVGTDKIYIGFVYLPHIIKRCNFIPIHCYKYENEFYHVFFRHTWICRECRYIINGSIIMPMVEADPTIYSLSRNGYPSIPLIFKKLNCPKCGKPLQNHLIIIK